MSRIRSIHPGFFRSEIGRLPPAAQLLFIGLWTMADDWGIFAWQPWKIKAELSPVNGSPEETERYLNDLASIGLIQRFVAGAATYGAIRNFVKYQRPQKPGSIYPCPADLHAFLGFNPDGSRPREMVRSINAKKNQQSRTGPVPFSKQSENSLPDNWKENNIPTRGELRYQDRAMHDDLGWDANFS